MHAECTDALYNTARADLLARLREAEMKEATEYEAPTLSVLGTLSDLTLGSSLNIAGDALLQAAASIIHIIP